MENMPNKKQEFAERVLTYLESKAKGVLTKNTLLLRDDVNIKLVKSKKNKNYRLHLFIDNIFKWAFTFKKIELENGKITCMLNEPSNQINKTCYKKFNITKSTKYLFCKRVSFDVFIDMYIKLLNCIIFVHEGVESLHVNSDYTEYFNGKIPICKSVKKLVHNTIEKYSNVHGEIQTKIAEEYQKKGWNVRVETFNSNARIRVDIVATKGKETIFFEVKPYAKARQCIREALGQLLEYSMYYSNMNVMATQLVVAGPSKQTPEDSVYLNNLREIHRIPIKYLSVEEITKKI